MRTAEGTECNANHEGNGFGDERKWNTQTILPSSYVRLTNVEGRHLCAQRPS